MVGAGFAGAVAARELAQAGHVVSVIDKRRHLGGNAYDHVDARGVRVHAYGPHLFHTSNLDVVDWLSAFTAWEPYKHRVCARLPDGAHAPLPINRRTLEIVFRESVPDSAAAEALLARCARADAEPRDAQAWLVSRIGPELTELFFARYTRKMWGLPLADMDASVVKRIPIRFDDEDRYFPNDAFQALPRGGYAALFEKIFDHPRIDVRLGVAFERGMLRDVDHAFLSSPIDEYFDYALGRLPYRSIRFHHHAVARAAAQAPAATVNYTDETPYTRETFWHLLPGHDFAGGDHVTRTVEEPCADHENGYERYYPVKTADGRHQALYRAYQDLAAREGKIVFIGRCGTYQYLDMDQVINQTRALCARWLRGWRPGLARAMSQG